MVQRSWFMEATATAEKLYVLAGRQCIAFFTKAADGKGLTAWELYQWQGQPAYLDCLQEATAQSTLFHQYYEEKHLVWQDAPATLLPSGMGYTDASAAAEAMLGDDSSGQLRNAVLGQYQCWWLSPADAEAALLQTMVVSSQQHLWEQMNGLPAGLYIDVCGPVLTAGANGENGLLWLNQYRFETPEDVLYHTLNALETLGLPPAATPVFLSGMVTPESTLYTTLRQYIPMLELRAAEVVSGEEPAHYFTLYQNL